jgi:hypothetical protein
MVGESVTVLKAIGVTHAPFPPRHSDFNDSYGFAWPKRNNDLRDSADSACVGPGAQVI